MSGRGQVVRRPPFSDNPTVGARGLRTRQRILAAALEVFGEDGYQRCSIDRITRLAGCSRVSFYQYFASKEDLFRQLAGEVGHQLLSSVRSLDPLTDGAAGWAAVRTWTERYAAIYDRYEAIFRAFPVAIERDTTLAGGSSMTGEKAIGLLRSKVRDAAMPPRLLDAVLDLLIGTATHAFDIASILRSILPEVWSGERVCDALADVTHRSIFGPCPGVNIRSSSDVEAPSLRLGPGLDHLLEQADLARQANTSGPWAALMEQGRGVFIRLGYHATRVDDIADAAGISHGAFYRYFANKDELVRLLASDSLRTVSTSLAEVPKLADGPALRQWLARYGSHHAEHVAMIRVWVDAGLADLTLRDQQAAIFDWGRRRMRRALGNRASGDVDGDALVMLALVEAFGSRDPAPSRIDAAVHVIEHGLLLSEEPAGR